MCYCTPAMRTPKCDRLECKPFVPAGREIEIAGEFVHCAVSRDEAIRIRDELNRLFPSPNSMQVRDEMLADRYGSAPA